MATSPAPAPWSNDGRSTSTSVWQNHGKPSEADSKKAAITAALRNSALNPQHAAASIGYAGRLGNTGQRPGMVVTTSPSTLGHVDSPQVADPGAIKRDTGWSGRLDNTRTENHGGAVDGRGGKR